MIIIHQFSFINATGGWVGCFIWRFFWILQRRLSKGNWRVSGIFYVTFSLNSSKTIIFYFFLDLPPLKNIYKYLFKGNWRVGVFFFIWRFFWILPRWLSKGNWQVSVLFYLTFFSEFFEDDYLNSTGGWMWFYIWRFLWILPRRLSSTFFLICVHWIT